MVCVQISLHICNIWCTSGQQPAEIPTDSWAAIASVQLVPKIWKSESGQNSNIRLTMNNFLMSHLYRIEASQQLHCLVSSNITFTKHYIDKDKTPPACFYAACLIVFMLQNEQRRFCDGGSARPEDRFSAVCVCTVFLTPVRQICSSVEAGPPCRQQLKRVWWWWCSNLIWGGSWWRYLLSGLRESERWEEGENGGMGV